MDGQFQNLFSLSEQLKEAEGGENLIEEADEDEVMSSDKNSNNKAGDDQEKDKPGNSPSDKMARKDSISSLEFKEKQP